RVVYFPFLQSELPPSVIGHMTMEVRTASEPAAMTNAIRLELLAVEKNLPIYGVKTLTQQVAESLTGERMFAWLTSLFGVLSVLLASVGLYGVIALGADGPGIGRRAARPRPTKNRGIRGARDDARRGTPPRAPRLGRYRAD